MQHSEPRWWQTGVVYEIYPRSFADTDGDGTGDLRGITGRLDYLAWLGVDAVWIAPFYPSPMADFGYDVADHTDVAPLFGTLGDFDELLADLRYGTIAVNCWTAVGYLTPYATWGAFPGHTPTDIQSGCGVVHNTFLFTQPQKTVLKAPFRMFPPRPPWLVTHRRELEVLRRITRFEAAPSPAKLPAIFWHSLRGW